jgi:hypothetical protein
MGGRECNSFSEAKNEIVAASLAAPLAGRVLLRCAARQHAPTKVGG